MYMEPTKRKKTAVELAAKLAKEGYCVVEGVYPTLRAELEQSFMKMPEFKEHPKFNELDKNRPNKKYGCGGTSFLGNPSIFHNYTSQEFRTRSAAHLMPILTRYVPLLGNPKLKLARYLDRIQVRPFNSIPSAEKWHRDAPPESRVDEFWLGGFQNCDKTNQKFSAIKGTHNDKNSSGGFAPIDASEIPKYNRLLIDQANQEDTDEDGNIIVPPGHLIVFVSTIAHQVYGSVSELPDARVKHFLGFRITTTDRSGVYDRDKIRGGPSREIPIEEVQARMRRNEVMVLPSGQVPPMYPFQYFSTWEQFHIFFDFEQAMLRPGSMRQETIMDPEKPSKPMAISMNSRKEGSRSMKSLSELGLPLYKYNQTELDAIRPQKDIRIHNFETGGTDVFSIMYEGAAYPTENKAYNVVSHRATSENLAKTAKKRLRLEKKANLEPKEKKQKKETKRKASSKRSVQFKKTKLLLCASL